MLWLPALWLVSRFVTLLVPQVSTVDNFINGFANIRFTVTMALYQKRKVVNQGSPI